MLDITTIILTYNEEIHIRRCLENVCRFSKKVIVVDSPSTDRTREIVEEFHLSNSSTDIEFVVHKYPGNQAEQFNWALDNCKIETEWILRLDADEYLTPELIEELQEKLPKLPKDVTGVELKRRHIFMEKWVKYGIYPVIILRLFRTGKGRYASRLMDEHISLSDGHSMVMENDFCDHSLITISDYCRKHIGYAEREATEALDEEYGLREHNLGLRDESLTLGQQAHDKQHKKSTYYRLPVLARSCAYFIYRYILKGGFLDGKAGFAFAFIQGWWYRTMVDLNILQAKRHCGDNKAKLIDYIQRNWGIKITQD